MTDKFVNAMEQHYIDTIALLELTIGRLKGQNADLQEEVEQLTSKLEEKDVRNDQVKA